MTKLIVMHYQPTDPTESISEIPPHVVLARRGDDGNFTQVGYVGGGLVDAIKLIGVCATRTPNVGLFNQAAFKPPHFFSAAEFFAAPKNFLGYYPQFVGLADDDEVVDWSERYADEDQDTDDLIEEMIDALSQSQTTIFGYNMPIVGVTVRAIEDLPFDVKAKAT